MKHLIIILCCVLLSGCFEKQTYKTLNNQGFYNIELHGPRIFNYCGEKVYNTQFKAMKNGREVTGYVCHNIIENIYTDE